MSAARQSGFLLEARALSRSFPGVRALDGVQLGIEAGKTHAVMGENGAGKSTFMRILAGLDEPDTGELLFEGRPVRLRSPHAALRLGIAMIHQELLPFPEMTVAENIFIGREPASSFVGWIDQGSMRREAERLLSRLGAAFPPGMPMKELSVAGMQMVEIAKALAHEARIIIMDEPTSALSEREAEALFSVIGDLRRRGVAIIYISHKLDEVFRLADAVTVLRDGRHVATCPVSDVTREKLIALMVGRELAAVFPPVPSGRGDVALSVRGLTKAGRYHDIHFDVRRGEILGIAGLMGAGRTELVSAISGLVPADSGEIWVRGAKVRIDSPGDGLANGIAMVTEDRKREGLVLALSVKKNLTLASLGACCRGGFIDHRVENRVADERIQALGIKTPGRDERVYHLSGGNQQKVVIGRALLTNPDILILDEPTRGIDIGAKAEVYELIVRLASEGKAILLVSSELPEVMALSHRILVMHEGIITAEVDPRRTTPEEILKHAMEERIYDATS